MSCEKPLHLYKMQPIYARQRGIRSTMGWNPLRPALFRILLAAIGLYAGLSLHPQTRPTAANARLLIHVLHGDIWRRSLAQ